MREAREGPSQEQTLDIVTSPRDTVDFSDRQHSSPIFFFQDITSKTKGTRTYTCLCALHARTARSLRRSMASLADHQAKESPFMDLLQDSISICRLLMLVVPTIEQQRRLQVHIWLQYRDSAQFFSHVDLVYRTSHQMTCHV